MCFLPRSAVRSVKSSRHWAAICLFSLAATAVNSCVALSPGSDGPFSDSRPSQLDEGIPPKLLPLIRQLRDSHADSRKAAADALGEMGYEARSAEADLVKTLRDSDESVRIRCAVALARIGGDAKPPVTALAELLQSKDSSIRILAITKLRAFGDEAVEVFATALSHSDGEVRVIALRGLGESGPIPEAHLPRVAKFLEDPDHKLQWRASLALGRSSGAVVSMVVPLLRHTDGEVRQAAARVLRMQEEAARLALPDLRESLKIDDPEFNKAVYEILARLAGPDGVPAPELLAALTATDVSIRIHCARVLAGFAIHRQAVLSAMLPLVREENEFDRSLSIDVLASIGRVAKPAIPALKEALSDPEGRVRLAAARALVMLGDKSDAAYRVFESEIEGSSAAWTGVDLILRSLGREGRSLAVCGARALASEPPCVPGEEDVSLRRGDLLNALRHLGPEAIAALPVLVGMLRDGGVSRRWAAASILESIGPGGREAAPQLREVLRGGRGLEKVAAARALGKLGCDLPEARSALTSLMGDPSPQVRGSAVEALECFGVPSEEDAAQLRAALQDANPDVRMAATLFQAKHGGNKASLIPVLIAIVKDPTSRNHRNRWGAITTLAEIGLPAREALPTLRAVVEQAKSPGFRLIALEALARIEPDQEGPGALRRILPGLRDPRAEMRAFTASVLGRLGKTALSACESLATGLRDPDEGVRLESARALVLLGTKKEAAAEALAFLMTSGDTGRRIETARALGAIGRDAAPAVPALTEALRDWAAEVREAAAITLGSIGPPAAGALHALTGLENDPDSLTRAAAAEAARLIQQK